MADAVVRKGARTRQAIVLAAIDLTAAEGLTGISFGKLAGQLGMSKSGLFAHFGTKEALQLATIEAAQARFVDAVIRPAIDLPRGLPRLWRLCRQWLDYARSGVFGSGCFFAAAAAEFDSRPGPVRERILTLVDGWTTELEKAIGIAQAQGHIDPRVEPRQLAFEIHALMAAANSAHQLYGGEDWFGRAQAGIRARLLGVLGPAAPALPGLQAPEDTTRGDE